jgi:tetratricopeptide (TPR) repeat protein
MATLLSLYQCAFGQFFWSGQGFMRTFPAILTACLTFATAACSSVPEPSTLAAGTEEGRSSPEHILTIASDLEAQGDTDSALTFYERAATLSETPVAYVKLGDAYLRVNRVDDATSAYRAALAREPENAQALLGLGGALIQSGNAKEAHNVLAKAAPMIKTPIAYNRLGLAQIKLGYPREALASFEEARELNERDTDIKTNLALAAVLNNQDQRAIGLMNELIAAQPSQLKHRRNLILVLGIAGKTRDISKVSKGLEEREIKDLLDRAEKIHKMATPSARAIAFSDS